MKLELLATGAQVSNVIGFYKKNNRWLHDFSFFQKNDYDDDDDDDQIVIKHSFVSIIALP